MLQALKIFYPGKSKTIDAGNLSAVVDNRNQPGIKLTENKQYLSRYMTGETKLESLLANITPQLNEGEFVFCSINNLTQVDANDILCSFREKEGTTVILSKIIADNLQLNYQFVSSWITLAIHSSLQAVGLTAAFSRALAEKGIACNVVAAFYHDHIFVPKNETAKAMETLRRLSVNF